MLLTLSCVFPFMMHYLCKDPLYNQLLLVVATVYAQVACALILAGKNLESHEDMKKILIEITIYFSVQVFTVPKDFFFHSSNY